MTACGDMVSFDYGHIPNIRVNKKAAHTLNSFFGSKRVKQVKYG